MEARACHYQNLGHQNKNNFVLMYIISRGAPKCKTTLTERRQSIFGKNDNKKRPHNGGAAFELICWDEAF